MKKILFFLCLVLNSPLSEASTLDSLQQLPTDSLGAWLDNHADERHELFLDVAYLTLNRLLQEEDYGHAADVHAMTSFWYYYNFGDQVDSTIYHRLKQIEYDEKIGDTISVGEGYIHLSVDFLNQGNLHKTQEVLLKAVHILKSLGNEMALAHAHTKLASLHVTMEAYKKAIYFAELSLPVLEEYKKFQLMVIVLQESFYWAYMGLEDYPKALTYIEDAIQLCITHQHRFYEEQLPDLYSCKAGILLQQEQFALADSLYRKAWTFEKEHNTRNTAERHRFGIGEVLYEQEKYEAALPHLVAGVKALEVALGTYSDCYRTLSNCYEKLGQYQEALAYRTKAFDLVYEDMEDQIDALKSEGLLKYETGRKDQQLEEQAQLITQKNWMQWLSIGAAALLAVLLSTLFYFFRKNQKASILLVKKNAQIVERNQQNELLLKEIHHRVKNNLQVISSLLNFQSRSISDKGVKMALLDSQSRVRSMSLIHQKLYRGQHLAAVEMKSYLENLAESLVDAYSDEEDILVEINMDTIELDVDHAIPLGLIANELVTNSLKYAFPDDRKGAIKIRLHQQDNDIILQVADDGVGKVEHDTTQRTDGGFGSELVDMLSIQLKGAVEQTFDNGYQTLFRFPYRAVA